MVVLYILILCKGRCLDPPIGESKTSLSHKLLSWCIDFPVTIPVSSDNIGLREEGRALARVLLDEHLSSPFGPTYHLRIL